MPDKVCKAFKKCGGCQLAMSYDEQLRYKNQKAKRLLSQPAKTSIESRSQINILYFFIIMSSSKLSSF